MYGLALADAAGERERLGFQLRFQDGPAVPFPVERYVARADADEEELLDGIAGPVLDVGCGPGRHLRALTNRGVFALGVDLSPVAVGLALSRGGRAIVGDVFGDLPGAGSWRTALLLDGNIGIGGCPVRLLERLRSLLHPEGAVLVELERPGAQTLATLARLEDGVNASDWFPWARVSASEIAATAMESGLTVTRLWSCGERWFGWLQPRPVA